MTAAYTAVGTNTGNKFPDFISEVCFLIMNTKYTAANADKNEYFAALSLSTFKALATVIVIPDLDVPGNAAAIACDNPIKNDCLNVISSYLVSDGDFLSTTYKTIPSTIRAIAIIIVSIPNLSQIYSENLSKTKLTIPVGIVTATMYQKILPSVDFSFFITLHTTKLFIEKKNLPSTFFLS